MAESKSIDPQDWLIGHQRLRELTLRMQALAREEQWGKLTELVPEQAALANTLGTQVPSAVIGLIGESTLASSLATTEAANAEVIARMSAWQNSLQASLQQLGNAHANMNRLSKAYR